MLRRWTDYRQRQRAALRESYRSRPYDERPEQHEPNLISDTLPPLDGAVGTDEAPADPAAADDAAIDHDPTHGRAPEGATAIGRTASPIAAATARRGDR